MTDSKTQNVDISKEMAKLKQSKNKWILGAVLVLGMGAVGSYYFFQNKNTAIEYVSEALTQGPLSVTVLADGALNPRQTVSIGSELSGIVKRVLVDVNDEVKAGDVLIELDDTKLQSALKQAEATLGKAKAQDNEAQTTLNEAQKHLTRLLQLHKLSKGKMPSELTLDQQRSKVALAKAGLLVAKASIKDAEATLTTAQTNLAKTKIRASVDGMVLARSVEPGYAVAASLQAVELLKLGSDLRQLELQVAIDEADIGSVKVGQKTRFTVSTYPDKPFPAVLKKVAFGSSVEENVVTYTAYLEVDNHNLLLRPGMSASAVIQTAQKKDVLLIPNAAYRYRPSVAKEKTETISLNMRPMGGAGKKSVKENTKGTGTTKKTIYLLKEGKAVPVEVVLGLTDGTMSEVISGPIKVGDLIIKDQLKAR